MTVPSILRPFVFARPRFVDAAFCGSIRARADRHGFHAATLTSDLNAGDAPDIRNNDRVIFAGAALARQLWHKASPLFATPSKGWRAVSLHPRFRVYRYRPGQVFDWHQDGEVREAPALRSLFTMMIYLNAECEGGGTSFADAFSPHVFKDFTLRPEIGKALFFHHPLSHRGEPVLRGETHVLRSDVMFEEGT